jgi:hypothetical protein
MVVCLVYVIIEYNLLFARLVFCYDGRMDIKRRIICDRVPLLMWGGYITHFIIIAPLFDYYLPRLLRDFDVNLFYERRTLCPYSTTRPVRSTTFDSPRF